MKHQLKECEGETDKRKLKKGHLGKNPGSETSSLGGGLGHSQKPRKIKQKYQCER